MKHLILTILIVLTTLTLATCGPRGTRLSPTEGAAYAAEVEDIVENTLVGWSECDFDMATRDFDPAWEGFFEENPFPQLCDKVGGVYGTYQSKTLDHVEDLPGEERCVIYHVVFENDPDVTLSVCSYIDDPDYLITTFRFTD